jgi:hypothetical protein
MSSNNYFGYTRTYLNQDLNRYASPTFSNVYCETPVVERWEDVNVAPFSTSLGPSIQPPNIVKFRDNGAGSAGVYLYGFDEKKEEEIFFSVQLPHSYRQGTDIKPHVHFCTPTQTATTITWNLEYTWQNINAAYPATTTIISKAVACPIAYVHTICSLGDISGVGKTISSILVCRLSRSVGGYVGNALLLSTDIHIQLDTIGSANETSK